MQLTFPFEREPILLQIRDTLVVSMDYSAMSCVMNQRRNG